MRIFLAGYPGEMGGANTEAWHTIKLWRQFGIDVHLIPTWGRDAKWQAKLDAIGCTTHHVTPAQLATIKGLAGSPVVSMCNSAFLAEAHRFRELGCPIVWVNCMTFLFSQEEEFFYRHGPADAMVYQSEFQRGQIEPHLAKLGYDPTTGFLIRGAFTLDDFSFAPLPHSPGEPFWIGRVSRPDIDKWSSNTWPIYERIQYANKRARMLGMAANTHQKLGKSPPWAECLAPMAISAQEFFAGLHATLPINGGARENWPRAGLEAMAAGVPIVAQNEWGWREMIIHGETGFLGSNDAELAHWAACLAYDEPLRLRIVRNAYDRMRAELANPERIWDGWQQVFNRVTGGPNESDNEKTKRKKEHSRTKARVTAQAEPG